MQTEFTHYLFKDLSNILLYKSLKLRSDVFVVEQNCVYPDLDDKDMLDSSIHVLATSDLPESNTLVAYARCLAPGVSYEGSSIGRVAVGKNARGKRLAHKLMQTAITLCFQRWPNKPIEIGAQVYLQDFYSGLGFVPNSEPYDEDGIMHIDMKLNYKSIT